MVKWKLLGELERRVMEHLWHAVEPQTVREDSGGRRAAMVHFVARVGTDDVHVLQRALAELQIKHTMV